jgi:hypothetical protein
MAHARRRVLRGLVAVVAAYWVVLVLAALHRPLLLLLEMRGRTGTRMTAGLSDEQGLSMTIDGELVWRAAFGLSEALAWIVVPPLLMWVAWLVWAARRHPAPLPAADGRAALGRGAAGEWPTPSERAQRVPVDDRPTDRQ